MWDTEERRKYFEINEIDPYLILDSVKGEDIKIIKKKYHKLAKQIHPDKTNGATNLQFKILKECYLFIADEETIITDGRGSYKNINELKEERDRNSVIGYDPDRDLYKTNFEDHATREKLFAVNDINFSNIDKIIDEKKKETTNYSSLQGEFRPKNLFANRKKFSNKYFNECFEIQKELNQSLIKTEISELDAFTSVNVGEISYYNDVIIEKKTEKNGNFQKWKTDENLYIVSELSEKELKKLIKQRKLRKNDSPDPTDVLFAQRKNEAIPEVNNTLSFSEAAEKLRTMQLSSSRDRLAVNKEYNKSKLSIYPESFRKTLNY